MVATEEHGRMMFSEQRIKSIFPVEWAVILDKCGTDPVLIEICEDLDRLAEDMEIAERDLAYMSDSLKADVLRSMEALVHEIRQKLHMS